MPLIASGSPMAVALNRKNNVTSRATSPSVRSLVHELDGLTVVSSTIARSFSLELQDIFRIDDSITELDTKLEERCVTQPHKKYQHHNAF